MGASAAMQRSLLWEAEEGNLEAGAVLEEGAVLRLWGGPAGEAIQEVVRNQVEP